MRYWIWLAAGTAALALSGCASRTMPPSLNGTSLVTSPPASAGASTACSNHWQNETLTGYWCRFTLAEMNYRAAARNHDYAITAQNILSFTTAAGVAATLVLNDNGLTQSQTDDLTEAGLLLGIVTAGGRLFQSEERRQLYLRASDTAACYASHIAHLGARQANFAAITSYTFEDAQRTLGQQVAVNALLVDQLISETDPLEGEALAAVEAARNAITAATAIQDQIEVQSSANTRLIASLREVAYDLGRTVEERAQNQPVSYSDLFNAIRDQAPYAPAATDPELPETDDNKGLVEGAERSTLQSLLTETAVLTYMTARVEALLPDIGGLRTSMAGCETVLETGQRIRFDGRDTPAGAFNYPGSTAGTGQQQSQQQPQEQPSR